MTRLTQTFAIVAALIAVGAGSATAAKLITGKQIKDHSITKKDLKPGVIPAAAAGPVGPAGAAGQAAAPAGRARGQGRRPGTAGKDGADGAKGDTGPSAVAILRAGKQTISGSQFRTVATQTLTAGTYAVSASFNVIPTNGSSAQSCSLNAGGTEVAKTAFGASAGERVALTLSGRVVVPAGSQTLNLSCVLEDDAGIGQQHQHRVDPLRERHGHRLNSLFGVDDVLRGKRIVICAGPGGVGKTTTSAAIAAGLAAGGARVAVITIDPARRLADALGLDRLDDTPRRVAGRGRASCTR